MRRHPQSAILLSILATFIGLALLVGAGRPSIASTPLLRLAAPATSTADDELIVEVHAVGVVNLGGWEATLGYDRSLLTLVDVESTAAFGAPQPDCDVQLHRCAMLLGPRPILGGVSVGAVSLGAAPGLHGDGVIARLHFQPTNQPGVATFTLRDALVTDIYGQAVAPQTESAQVSLGVTLDHRVFLPAVNNQPGAGE